MVDITDQSGNLTDFLQQKAAQNKLIIKTGSTTTTGNIISYTPTNGNTFVLVKASVRVKGLSIAPGSSFTANLRNNGTILDTIVMDNNFQVYGDSATRLVIVNPPNPSDFIITGDQLIGDGSKSYDINISNISTITVYGTILGYLL